MTKAKIKKALMEQLAHRGADLDHFKELVCDYCDFWEIAQALKKDIKDRGVVYSDVSSVGVPMQKNNPSVKELVNVNKQMLVVLEKLKLSVEEITAEDGEDDEL